MTPAGEQMQCKFCGTVIERSAAATPKPVPATSWTVVEARPGRPPRISPVRRGSCIAAIAGILVLAIAGIATGIILWTRPTPQPPQVPELPRLTRRHVSGEPIPLVSDRAGPSDLLVPTYHIDDQVRTVSLLDPSERAMRWDSPALSTGFRGMATADQARVYLVEEDRLIALARSDGAPAWEVTLADSVLLGCEGCLRSLGGYVVVLSQDGTLQSFQAATGQPAWSLRLNETPRNMWAIGGRVAVLDTDTPADWRTMTFQLRDPASMDVALQIPARYTHDGRSGSLRLYSPNLLVSPDEESAYFLYGSHPGCAQRWDLSSGELVWQTVAEDHQFDHFHGSPLLTAGTIYGGYDHLVIALDTARGDVRTLTEEHDYELTPLAAWQDVLIVQARRTRGSERYELWGLDAETDGRRWQHVLKDELPLEAAGAATGAAYAAFLAGDHLVLIHLIPEPPRMTVEMLDPLTGESGGQTVSELDDDYWEGVVRDGEIAWVATNKVYAVDLGTGKVIFSWP